MPDDYLGKTVGTQRSKAVYRLLGLVYLVTLYPIVAAIGFVGGLLFMLGDVIWQLTMNRGLRATSGRGTAGYASRLFRWPLDQLGYIFVGEPSTFPFTP